MKSFVLSFVAMDRPGLVEKLSQTLTVAGGNWLESRMARLAEKFDDIALLDKSREMESVFSQPPLAIKKSGFHPNTRNNRGKNWSRRFCV